MVHKFECIFSHMRAVNFKIFSNHGGQFECIFSHMREVNFKIFSNHGGQFECIFSHTRVVIFTFSPTMVDKLVRKSPYSVITSCPFSYQIPVDCGTSDNICFSYWNFIFCWILHELSGYTNNVEKIPGKSVQSPGKPGKHLEFDMKYLVTTLNLLMSVLRVVGHTRGPFLLKKKWWKLA